MAAEGPLKELCEEASCSICLDFFSDPVTIAECGHNFCRACLTRSWGESGAQEPSCPQCRGRTQKRKLRPNQQLANIVEIAKKLRPLEGKGGEGEGGVCEKLWEPLKLFYQENKAPFYVVCGRSQQYQDHWLTSLEEATREKEQTVVAARKERVCQKHREPLNPFCNDHEPPVCVVCEQSQEHKYNEFTPGKEASHEYKEQFCSSVEILWKERNKILEHNASIVKESQDLLRQTEGERKKILIKFRQLHKFLEEQEKLLLAKMEEAEKEVVKKRDQHLARLSESLFSLESLVQEMVEKRQQPTSDHLQGARSLLQKFKEKEFENAVVFPLALKWCIWDFADFSPLLEAIQKQIKDTLDSELHLQKANVTLDPDTAHPELVVSEDQKSVRRGYKTQVLHNNLERFEKRAVVLGREGFTGGRHFWEVIVESKDNWRVGVARKSVRRKGGITLNPQEGFWGVGKWLGGLWASENGFPPRPLTEELKRIRVSLNYAGGRVAFFDADRAALLHEFSGISFHGEALLPLFWVTSKGHLKITS